MKEKLLSLMFCVGVVSLFFFSFTQVDLSLTLSRVSIWQGIEKFFQQIGYFNRPLSTFWYIISLIILFVSYLSFLYMSKKGMIKRKTIWKLIIFSAVLLTVSYNAFSYDIFNYIFYAKIVTFYHQNPYIHKALDFPKDPMLSFMHWTHNTYPYGPFWLAISIPLSYIGFNFFLPTFFIFKFFAMTSFLTACYLIERISVKLKLDDPFFNLVFFGLNPLVMIESLVSGHNDIFMMALSLGGIYFLLQNKKAKSLLFLMLSFLIKWATGVLLLPFVLFAFGKNILKNNENFIGLCLFMSFLGLIYALTRYEMQPWYFLWVLPFIAIYKKNLLLLSLSIGLSVGLLLSYALFFQSGNWDSPIPTQKTLVIIFSGILGPAIFYLAKRLGLRLYF